MITSLLALALVAQGPLPGPSGSAPQQESAAQQGSAAPPESSGVGDLKRRIHTMRVTLVAGGEKVREADSQALEFYGQKAEQLARRGDAVATDLTERGAEYEVALERVLSATSPEARKAAAEEAAKLRHGIAALEAEADDNTKRRRQFQRAADLVRERVRQRARLAERLDAPGEASLLVPPLPYLGLAPDSLGGEEQALADPDLMDDLMRRDPRRARRILCELNPAAYWRRWPLLPPADILRKALPFPLPDPPGGR